MAPPSLIPRPRYSEDLTRGKYANQTAGHTQDEISAAWREARQAGYTESTGLGMDRLTAAGKARAVEIRDGNDDVEDPTTTVGPH